MQFVIGSYDELTGVGTACLAGRVTKRYLPAAKGQNPFHPSLEDGFDAAPSDVVKFFNTIPERRPMPGTVWRLTPTHEFTYRDGGTYYCSAKLDQTSRFISAS